MLEYPLLGAALLLSMEGGGPGQVRDTQEELKVDGQEVDLWIERTGRGLEAEACPNLPSLSQDWEVVTHGKTKKLSEHWNARIAMFVFMIGTA